MPKFGIPTTAAGSTMKRTSKAANLLKTFLINSLISALRTVGSKTRDWADSHYADGSVADYYGILRYARQQGIPGIIVEHAFITNSGDASKLAQDSWLKAMGEADRRHRRNIWTSDEWQLDSASRRLLAIFHRWSSADWLVHGLRNLVLVRFKRNHGDRVAHHQRQHVLF